MNFSTTVLFLTTLLLANESHASYIRSSMRLLAGPVIAGFEPSVDVTDLSRIDLDQRAMETQNGGFNAAAFERGRMIYNSGGNSESVATLTLTAGLPGAVSAGTNITGLNAGGGEVKGVSYEQASAGATTIQVRYNVGIDIQPCAVGGLTLTNTTGCLASSGSLTVGALTNVAYTYVVNTGNQNGRSMKKFITDANIKLRKFEIPANAFYDDFQKFFEFYGTTDFTDKIVNGAIDGLVVTLAGRPYDFSSYDFNARDQIIKKTTHYQIYPMYVIRQLEVALEKCSSGRRTDALRALDEAVAIYAGSVEGASVNGTGNLLLGHSRRRCGGFKTCGASGNETTGLSKNNIDVLDNFNQMKLALNSTLCAPARTNKEFIAKKIFVPFIQGGLRYGYLQSPPGTGKTATAEAEGAAFVMAVLPIVARCSAAAANVIYNEMKPNSGFTVNITAVKEAFESNYRCMGIACADMGGLWDSVNARYFAGAEPCTDRVVTTNAPVNAPAPVPAPVVGTPVVTTPIVTPVVPSPVPAPVPAPIVAPVKAPVARLGFFASIWRWFLSIFGL